MIALESLLEAWDEFKKGKLGKADVQQFEVHLEDNLFKLAEDLKNRSYQHGPYENFYIRDPKVRLIHKSSVRDRIVHHAVFKVLNNIFEATFIFDSYSCRIDKGTHRAVVRLKKFADEILFEHRRCFVLKCDIKKFFHSVDHQILLRTLRAKVSDPDILWLSEILINSFSAELTERERERERVKGAL